MTKFSKFAVAASVLALMSAAAGAVHAQETTGGIKGVVTNDQGTPVAGAKVTIVHEPTGVTVTTKTDSSGYFIATSLRVGGPYKVSIAASGYAGADTEVPFVNLGEPTEADVNLHAQATEVVIKGRRREVVAGRTKIAQEEVQTFPTLNRDIRDYALKSPSAYEDPTNQGALIFSGFNNRSNAILVDGVRQGDDFGLNANGLPTNRSPISVDSVEAVNVDTAPYDVQYSYFQGGVLNFVTKSGGNQFHGSIFEDKTGNNMRGHHVSYNDVFTGTPQFKPITGNFSEKTWGANLSGPIIKDKLFFFALYENFEGSKPNLFGASDSGKASPVPNVTNAQVAQVVNDIKTLYGYDPLGVVDSIPYTDTKVQLKIDWQIKDGQRAVFSYIDTKSGSANEVGDSTSTTSGTLALGSKFYTLENDLKVYKGQLLSNWTDNFSTEFNLSRKEVVNKSVPLAGNAFAQFKVLVNGTAGSLSTSGQAILLGPDISRHENVLTNNVDHIDLKGKYRWNKHNFLFGVEHEHVSIFNAFVQNANGQYVFGSIADLEAKKALSITYANAADNIKEHGAANFTYGTTTFYVQDTWRVTPRLTVTPGLRYDTYTSKILPGANATFLANYGFTNAKGLDGLHALQPRINFNWHPSFDNSLIIYGGYGVFQGGNPNVWISNSYTNTGSLLGTFSCTRVATPTTTAQTNCNNALTGIDGFNVAQFFKDQNTASAVAGTGNTNAIAPGFKMPSVWKASLGVQKNFDFGSLGDNYTFVAEYSVSKFLSAPFWQDLYQEKALSGTAPDGRPEYFGLVNGGIKKNRTDVVLTEAALGKARSLSLQMSKTYHSGWADGLSFDAAVTFSKATDINSGTSSVATSSYRQSTWSDPNHPGAATSNYQIDTIAKLTLGYEHKFFGDNRTSFRLYNQFRTGQRFSFVFSDAVTSSPATANAEANASTGAFGMNSLYSTSNVELLYVPKLDSSGNVTLTSDPLVKFKSQADADTFNAFIHNFGLTKYAGTIAPRNAFKSPDNFFSNLRIMQELPAINPNWGKLEAWMDITNLGNMINDHYGVLTQVGFPYNRFGASVLNCQAVAQTANGASGTCAVGTGNFYQYTPVTQSALNPDVSSVYQVKFGLRYKF